MRFTGLHGLPVSGLRASTAESFSTPALRHPEMQLLHDKGARETHRCQNDQFITSGESRRRLQIKIHAKSSQWKHTEKSL